MTDTNDIDSTYIADVHVVQRFSDICVAFSISYEIMCWSRIKSICFAWNPFVFVAHTCKIYCQSKTERCAFKLMSMSNVTMKVTFELVGILMQSGVI